MRKHIQWIGTFLVIYTFLLGTFYFTSIGTESYRILLNMRRYFPCALSVAFSIWIWKRYGLPTKALLPYGIVGVGWVLSFNISDYIAYRNSSSNINNYLDIAFGAYVFSSVVLLRILIFIKMKKDCRVVQFFFSVLHVVLFAIPAIQIVYFLYYKTSISMNACIALLQTNWAEVKEFLIQNLGYGGIIGAILCIIFMIAVFMYLNTLIKKEKILQRSEYANKKIIISVIVIFIGICCYLPKNFLGTGVIRAMNNARSYMSAVREFNYYHDNNFNALQVESPVPAFSEPSTIILIIGESAGRNFMSAYGYKANDTTPWLRQSVSDDSKHFLKFNHVYSSWGSTVQSLEMALTQKNQYNQQAFNQSLTILDLAKKAGYRTYWFSNQGTRHSPDTPITLVAKTADYSHWIEDDHPDRIAYDGDLLPWLEKVNPNENNFIVIHILGSHELTLHRFPPEFTKFSQPGVFDLVPNYEDSMAYSDWVLQQIFTYACKNLNLQVMMFFSDHGANPYRKRTADNIPFINLRIPFILYLSDEYQFLYPQTTAILKSHLDTYITNDLMYEAVGGILNIKSNQLDETANIASSSYAYTRESLKTNLGKSSLSEDLYEDRISVIE